MFEKINIATNLIAEQIKIIRESMRGKGISPKDAQVVEFEMEEMENKLRMIGADEKNPVPYLP